MKQKEQKISIDGKSINIKVFKPRLFQAFIDTIIKNYDARQLVKDMSELNEKDASTNINVGLYILGRIVKVRIAACETLDDLEFLFRSLKNMKEMHRTINEYDDVIEITTNAV